MMMVTMVMMMLVMVVMVKIEKCEEKFRIQKENVKLALFAIGCSASEERLGHLQGTLHLLSDAPCNILPM